MVNEEPYAKMTTDRVGEIIASYALPEAA